MTQPALLKQIDPARLPAHVAIIMDGNGRWAKARGLDRSEGHIEGVNTVRRITELASDTGIRYLTLYTFSTENWNRPREEVDALMALIAVAIKRETPDLIRNNVRLKLIGDFTRVPQATLDTLNECLEATAHCTGLVMNLAISYSARWEITRAAKLIADEVKAGTLSADEINDDTFAAHLTTAGMPDPDLLIRTGGDMRVSNFLLWQIAYSEIIVTDTFWPDYTNEEFLRAILQYQQRERRFGQTSEQVTTDKERS